VIQKHPIVGVGIGGQPRASRRLAHSEFVLGVNVLNPHGFHYTLEGARKRDWPPSMFYQYPWWRHYERFSEYMSRLSESLTGGRHVAKVAVLYPINAMFAEYLPQAYTPAQEAIESAFNSITDALLRLHHDFDYLDEDVLAEATIVDGRVLVGDEEYELVLVPPMTHTKLATVDALERFTEGGGKVLGLGLRPERVLGPDGLEDAAERVRALFSGERAGFIEGDASALAEDARSGGRRLRDAIDAGIRALIEPDITIENDELFALHRRKDGTDLYFVTNPTFEEQRARISFPGDVQPVLLDPTDGAERPVGPIGGEDGRTWFELALPPVGSTFVVLGIGEGRRIVDSNLHLDRVTDAEARGTGTSEEGWIDVRVNGHVARASARAGELPEPLVLDGPWRFEPESLNALVLDRWEASPEREGASGTSPDDADPDGWVELGHGAWSYQLGAEPTRRYPIPVWYRVAFDVDAVPSRLELVIDGFDGTDHRIHLNGTEITAAPVRASFDAQMRSVDLTPQTQQGRNELMIRLVVDGPTGGIVDRLKLMGTFSLARAADGGWRIAAPAEEATTAPWTDQGHPFLSGTATYRRSLDVPPGFAGHRVFLDVPTGDDVIEVIVNGRSAGIRTWDPYEVEVTELLVEGSNEIAIASTNTLANLLNAEPRPSGLAGPPRLLARASFAFDLAAAEAAPAQAPMERGDG
jgi:hypothetical protein